MMPGHHPCDGKHHLDANLTLKVWTLVVSRRLQSRLAMPRWSKPAASSLSKLPIGPLKVADVTGVASEATWQRRTASGPRYGHAPVLPVGESRPIGSCADPASRFRKAPPY